MPDAKVVKNRLHLDIHPAAAVRTRSQRVAAGHSAALVRAESGCVDRSHLHRELMAFAGVTPTAIAVAPFLAVNDVAWAAPKHASGM